MSSTNVTLWKGFVQWRQEGKMERVYVMVTPTTIHMFTRMVEQIADGQHIQLQEIALNALTVREWLRSLTLEWEQSGEKTGIMLFEQKATQAFAELTDTLRKKCRTYIQLLPETFYTGFFTKGKFKRGKPRFFKKRWFILEKDLFRIRYFTKPPETMMDVSTLKGSVSLLGCSSHESEHKLDKSFTIEIENFSCSERWCFAFETSQLKLAFSDMITNVLAHGIEVLKKCKCKGWLSVAHNKRKTGAMQLYAVVLPYSIVMFKEENTMAGASLPDLSTQDESETISLIGSKVREIHEPPHSIQILTENSSVFTLTCPDSATHRRWMKYLFVSMQNCEHQYPQRSSLSNFTSAIFIPLQNGVISDSDEDERPLVHESSEDDDEGDESDAKQIDITADDIVRIIEDETEKQVKLTNSGSFASPPRTDDELSAKIEAIQQQIREKKEHLEYLKLKKDTRHQTLKKISTGKFDPSLVAEHISPRGQPTAKNEEW